MVRIYIYIYIFEENILQYCQKKKEEEEEENIDLKHKLFEKKKRYNLDLFKNFSIPL